jgi:signal transduction histidine kinase
MASSAEELIKKEKHEVINLILVIFAIAGTFVTGISLLRVQDLGMMPSLWIQVVLVTCAIFIAIFRKSLPLTFKILFAVSINLLIGLAGIISFAMIDGSVMVLITAVIIASVLGSSRIAIGVVAVSVFFLTILALLVQNGIWTFDIDANTYMYSLPAWLIFIVAFAVLSLLTVFIMGKMSTIVYNNVELLEDQRKQLEEANNTKDRLFQMIAHDLRSPFQGLISGLELFSDEADMFTEEQKTKMFRSMLRDSTSTFSMLENLLYWSRAQTGDLNIQKKYIDVENLMKATINPYLRVSEQKNISIATQISPSTLIYADESSIKIVLSNLIHNAIKFTERNGKIEVSASSEKSITSITICDNGIGIKSKNIDKLFNNDHGFSTRGTENEKGTGLGLGISYELIQRNNGELSFNENKFGGSSFTITLPSKAG